MGFFFYVVDPLNNERHACAELVIDMYAVVYVPLLLTMQAIPAGVLVKNAIHALLTHGCCLTLVEMWEAIAKWYDDSGKNVPDTGVLLLDLFGQYLREYIRLLYSVPCEIPSRQVVHDPDKDIIVDAYMDEEDPSNDNNTAFPIATASVSRLTST